MLDNVPVTLIPLGGAGNTAVMPASAGSGVPAHALPQFGQFYINGKATSPVPVVSIDRDLQKLSLSEALVQQQ